MNRRQFLRWSATATAAALGVGGYTWQIEPHWVEVVERGLPIDGLPPELAGYGRAWSEPGVALRVMDGEITSFTLRAG